MGADHVVDLVLQIGGDTTFDAVVDVLAPFGRIVVYGIPGGHPLCLDAGLVTRFFHAPALNQSLHAFNVGLWFGLRPQTAVAALTTLLGQIASGRVKIPLGAVLPLDRAAEAHHLLESRATVRKDHPQALGQQLNPPSTWVRLRQDASGRRRRAHGTVAA